MTSDSLARANRFEVDIGAIAHNVGEVRRLVGDSTQIVTALKANAYGYGLEQVAKTVIANGADIIAVADLSDAVFLRERGNKTPILLYPGNSPENHVIVAVAAHGLMPTIFDLETARLYASQVGCGFRVFVKVDIGLERFGVVAGDAVALIKQIRDLGNLEVHGVYAHVDVPDTNGAQAYINWQYATFMELCAALETAGISIPIKMLASSAVLGFSASMNLTAVDPGHLLFGLQPPGPRGIAINVRPALYALKSRLIHVRGVERTKYVEMMPFPIRDGMRFGVIPIGLRDGMASINAGRVLVRGQSAPIIGYPSLEHTRIDLTDVLPAAVGDEVVLIGAQGNASISTKEVTVQQGLGVKVELALAVRESVPRVYV